MSAVAEDLDFSGVESSDFFAPTDFDAVDALVGEYDATRADIERIAAFMDTRQARGGARYFFQANRERFSRFVPDIERVFDAEQAIKALNADYWQRALQMTDVLDYMPAAKRRQWNEQIDAMDTPPFDEDTVRDNLRNLLAQRMNFLAEMVDGIFRGLSGDHVTNRPEGFAKRMIIAHCFTDYGWPHGNADLLHDLRCVVARLMQRGQPGRMVTNRDLKRFREETGVWHLVDGGAFRIRVYLKGTAHMEVHPDIAWRLNDILAHLHPSAIPARHRQKPRKATREFVLFDQPISFPILAHIGQARLSLRQDGCYTLNMGVDWSKQDKHVKAEVGRILGAIGGAHDDNRWYVFDYDAKDAIDTLLTTGMIPDHKAYQYYPTPEPLARAAIERAAIGPADQCLEPSAGQGALARLMPAERTYCVEASALHCEILCSKGYAADCADFLAWISTDRYDRIVMNPPFSQGRAQAHLEHAASLLAAGGRLVAILPASFAGKNVLPDMKVQWSQVYDGAFAGASMSVVILVAEK